MKNLKGNIFFKIAVIIVLILLLLIPASMVQDLIHEREQVQKSAITEVSEKWANRQTITGPYIAIPYDKFVRQTINHTEKVVKTRDWIYILPEELNINGKVDPNKRYRGIYEVVVYDSEFKLTGHFKPLNLDEFDIPKEQIHLDKATVNVGITDLKGIEKQVQLNWNSNKILFNSGVASTDIVQSGINAQVEDLNDSLDNNYNFNFEIELKGSQNLNFVPVGKTTDVTLTSNWNTPSFSGTYLPDKREITNEGFTANWNILNLNRNFPQLGTGHQYNLQESAFGTDLLLPVDNYKKSYRVARYAILFLALTFMVFFFVEVLNKVFIHPIQYLLVGIAIIVFYTLLLSFSEHIHFNLAYIISAVLTLSLITGYTSAILKSVKVGSLIMGILLVLYTFIFTIIQLEDFALLIGSIGVFLILAIVMYFSRKIDWYNIRIGSGIELKEQI